MDKHYNEMPEIIYNEIKQEITITGNSIPEHGEDAWKQFIRALEIYLVIWPKLTINFKFDYYNTTTTKPITTIILMLYAKDKLKDIEINWYYLKGDEDMMESGEDYKEMYEFRNFNLIERQ